MLPLVIASLKANPPLTPSPPPLGPSPRPMAAPSSHMRPRAPHELPRSLPSLHSLMGFDTSRRSNIHCPSPTSLVYLAGNALVEYGLETKVRKYVSGLDGGSVGAFQFNPTGDKVAVACSGSYGPPGLPSGPNIYIYSYPGWEIEKVMKAGTEKGYSSLSWSADGTLLASVGCSPGECPPPPPLS